MSRSLAEYVALGYALSPGDRLKAARMLRLSVDQGVDSDLEQVDAAWRDEVGARVCDILVGAVELVDADETYRMLSAELGPSIGDARIASMRGGQLRADAELLPRSRTDRHPASCSTKADRSWLPVLWLKEMGH
jgi:hypothetical protein